jgi:transposase
MGEEISERYEYIPAQMLVIEDVCKKYACACSVKTASKPSQPIEKSTAGASLLAQVIVSKVADHLPVHRQAKILRRFGVEIADQTMCGWMRQSAELLDPLYVRLKQFVLSSKVVGTDDTPVKVLDRSLVRTTRKGRFWPYLGDRNHVAAVFDYTPTRERAGPERFLKGYRGFLQADAYVAYDSFFTDPTRGLVEVACWEHPRSPRPRIATRAVLPFPDGPMGSGLGLSRQRSFQQRRNLFVFDGTRTGLWWQGT